MDPDWQEDLASRAGLSRAVAPNSPLSADSEYGQAPDLGSDAPETGASRPRGFAPSRSRPRPQLITEEDGVELPVPGLESCSGSGGVCPDPSLPDGGAMPNAAADAPLNCNDIGSDQADTRFTPLQRDGSMPDAPEAIAAADSSMVVPNTAQKSTRDAVLLEITQIRADLEQHAARRASLHAELNAAGETMQAMGQAAMPPEGSLPENSQMQDDDTMKQVAGSDTHPLPSQEGQPLPRGPSQQQAHEAILGRLSNAERSEEPLTSVRRVSWSTPEEQGHGFALLWAPLAPPPRKFPTQSSAPLPLARSNSLPAQLGSAAPDTPISWPLPPLPQQRDVLSTSQNIIQRIIRRQTGDGRSGLPPIMSAPRSHPGATARPLHLEQDGHRREALLSLAGVPETAAGQGQPMLSSQPLYMSSRSSQQFSGVPDVTTSAAYRQRPRLRSDSGSLRRPRSAQPLSEAPLETVGSYLAAASDARERALLVAAARVRQQHEASLWRGASAKKRNAMTERGDRRPPLGPRRTRPAVARAAAGQRAPLSRERQVQMVDDRPEQPDWLASIAAQEASLLASLDRLDGLLWRKRAPG